MGRWDLKTVEDCCEILDSQRIPISDTERQKIQGNIPYYGANGIQGYINKYLFEEDLILIAEDGGNFEQFATRPIAYRISGKSWVNNHAHILRTKKDYNQDFIFYSLVHKNILTFIVGGTRSKLNQKELRSITIKIPDNEPEQTAIATIISKVDKAINDTEKIIEKYKRIKTGLMQELLTKGIDEKGNIRSEKMHRFKDSILGRIPEEWDVKTIKEISVNEGVQTGPFGAQLHSYEYVSEGVPLILIRNIIDGKIVTNDIPRIPHKKAELLSRYRLNEGDLVFSRVGDVGRVAVAQKEHKGWLFSGQTLRVRLKPNGINKFFIREITQKFEFRNLLSKRMLGTTRDSINTNILENMPLIFPKSEEEQNRIIDILKKVDENINACNISIEKLKLIKSGLMQDLLTGKVRVPEKLIKEINKN